MIFYTSDLHLGHKNIIKYENRPFNSVEEMDIVLIANWNARVNLQDDVYILGDFTFKGATQAIKYLNVLNGNIHLLRGNHDHFMKQDSFNRFAENTEFLINERRIINEGYYKHLNDNGREVVLFHYPIMFWDGQDDMGSYHLYGHMHKTSHGEQQHPHPDAFNVGVDVQNYAPVTLDELIARRSNGV